MELIEVARRQGPRARQSVLLLGLVGFIGGLMIASVRVARDGKVDTGSMLWVGFAVAWACGFAAVELLANRSLRRAAMYDMPDAADVILFRLGKVVDVSRRDTGQVGKGWIWFTDEELWIYVNRNRVLVAHSVTPTERTARAVAAPGSYGVLEISTGADQVFECIPVEVGWHNLGLSAERVGALSRNITREMRRP